LEWEKISRRVRKDVRDQRTEIRERRIERRNAVKEDFSIVITLLADGEGDGEAVAGWGKRAGGEGSVGARWIFEVIEIEDKFARFVEAVGGEAGIEETASAVGGRRAGGVTKDEEKFGDGGIFQNRLEAK